MSKHTPGPWRRAGASGEWINDEYNINICRISPEIRMTSEGQPCYGNKVDAGNARLIAAAPELLEAARNVVDAYRGVISSNTLDSLELAVAKAEGKGEQEV